MNPKNERDKIINSLKESPIFNLSLASKELFHSNFIAWLLERYSPLELIELFSPGTSATKIESVKREKGNIDLTITLNDKTNIIIENKVKSLPDYEQLKKYSTGNKGEKHIILSLSKPNFFDKEKLNINGCTWRYVNYTSLAKSLNEFNREIKDSYNQQLIADYIALIENLNSIKKYCEEQWKDDAKLLQYPSDELCALKQIRLHDIYEKWRMDTLRARIISDLKIKYFGFSVDYTNEQGLLDIHAPAGGNLSYFFKIQIQGNQLKQAIQANCKEHGNLYEKAEKIMESKVWFVDANHNPLPPNQHKKNIKQNLGFCKFSDEFVYRYEPLGNIEQILSLAKRLDNAWQINTDN